MADPFVTSWASGTCSFAHARKSAGLKVCGGWGLATSIMRTTTMLAEGTSIVGLSEGVSVLSCQRFRSTAMVALQGRSGIAPLRIAQLSEITWLATVPRLSDMALARMSLPNPKCVTYCAIACYAE